MGLGAAELARWKWFAAKGGIGKCTALCDCVVNVFEGVSSFLSSSVIVVLYRLPDLDGSYFGYCKGVVGRLSSTTSPPSHASVTCV
ncbi:hypothetical protein CPC08DRAFT_651344 [Agrocybe pediades]|nr:hypothetical protein CPC08DRAFT_651344 [Agrocybe pediades]